MILMPTTMTAFISGIPDASLLEREISPAITPRIHWKIEVKKSTIPELSVPRNNIKESK
jgi:hypothetical protein